MSDPPPQFDPSFAPPTVPYASPVAAAMVSRDVEHLRLLTIFHYIVGGIIAVFSSCGLIHLTMGLVMALNPSAFSPPAGSSGGGAPPPPFVGWVLALFAGGFVIGGWTLGALTIYSGRQLSQRRRRTFSLVVAALDCLMMPFGTVLGIVTIIVLMRESVRALYAQTPAPIGALTA